MKENNISNEEIELLNKYFRAANYLSACQLYLLDNPLLKEPLQKKHIKRKTIQKRIITYIKSQNIISRKKLTNPEIL